MSKKISVQSIHSRKYSVAIFALSERRISIRMRGQETISIESGMQNQDISHLNQAKRSRDHACNP